MNKRFKVSLFVFILILVLIPVLSLAARLVPSCSENLITGECTYGFNELLTLVNNVVNFILFSLAIPIAAIMFFYAGFLMVTAGSESASSRTKAKTIFTNTLIGLVIAAAAWVIVHTILTILGYSGSWIGF